jgi:hypothetical protein
MILIFPKMKNEKILGLPLSLGEGMRVRFII